MWSSLALAALLANGGPEGPAAALKALPPPEDGTGRPGAVRTIKPAARREHGAHLRTGVMIVPPALLGQFFDSFANSNCTGVRTARGASLGTNKVGGCNIYVEGGYRTRRRNLVLMASLGYARIAPPDSNWLGRGENLDAAQLTQIDLHLLSAQIDVAGEWPLGRRVRWRLGLSLGAAYLAGSVMRTSIGSQTAGCTLETLGDLRQCRPYRPREFDEPEREDPGFANCDEDGCSEADLIRAGRTATRLPTLVPTGRLYTGPRFDLGHRVGLSLDIGVGLGLTMGVGIDARFGR